ncbi:MAG: glycoside hydrolase family 172 protein, partial [Armatimonadota bacterium]
IDGPGVIRHIWITVANTSPDKMRNLILRFYWDDQMTPSVEAPLSDFFGVSHGRTSAYESEYLSMPEGRGFNCYFPMPFAKRAKLTVCNELGEDAGMFFYQVDYTIGEAVTKETPCFHSQFRRVLNTKLAEDYVILDGVKGKGRFLGVTLGLIDRFVGQGVWWGEGEVKMYIDGDKDYPTICGTGSEDYAGSGWGLGQFHAREMGAPFIQGKFVSFYRFHARDPIYFSNDIRVTVQQIGNDGKNEPADPSGPLGEFIARGEYRKDHPGGNFERVDDVCSTAYWYQTLPTMPFSPFPDKALRTANLAD